MKKIKMKKLLAAMLSVVLVLQTGVYAFAEPETGIPEVESVSQDEAPVNDDAEAPGKQQEVSQNEADAAEEPEAEEDIEDEAATEEETPEVSENEAGSMEAEAENTVLMEETAENFEGIESLEADEDYDADTVFFRAETEEKAREVAQSYGGTLESYAYEIGVIRFDEKTGSVSEHVLNAVRDNKNIDTVVYPNYYGKLYENSEAKQEYSMVYSQINAASGVNDPLYEKQWFHGAINNEDAWTRSTGKGVVVGVVDSGVDLDHEDLKDNIAGSVDVITEGGSGQDDHNHGSNCAGIIAAVRGNGKGGAGVAPDAKIFSAKAADSEGYLSLASQVMGVRAATEYGVNIISMSFGGHGNASAYRLLQDAVNDATNAGIICIAAAGNECTSNKAYPAALNNVLAVAAYNEQNGLCPFSNYGKWVDIAAPGNNILSLTKDGKYGSMNGTSQATPMVSAVAALIYSSNPEFLNNKNKTTVDEVKRILLSTTDGFTYSCNGHSQKGGVDAAKALGVTKPALEMPQKPEITSVVNEGNGQVTVSIQTATAGASIYYTLDESSPATDTKRIKYSSPIVLSRSGKYTVKAVSVKEYSSGQLCSDEAKTSLTVNATASAKDVITSTEGEYLMDTVSKTTADMSGVLTGGEYTFSSSNKKAATVNDRGIITAVGNGKAKITAKQKGAKEKVTVNIKVTTPVTGIKVKTSTGLVMNGTDVKNAVIAPGGSIKLTALLSGAKTPAGNVKPSVTGVEWTSGNPDLISVSGKGVLKCPKKANTGGTSVITCSSKDGSGVSISFEVKVVPKAKMLGDLRETCIYSVHKKLYNYMDKAVTKSATKCDVGGSIKVSELYKGAMENFRKVTKYQKRRELWGAEAPNGRMVYDYAVAYYYSTVPMYDEMKAVLPKNSDTYVKSLTRYGTPDEIVFSKPGTYTLKLMTIDGSNKAFKLIVHVQ